MSTVDAQELYKRYSMTIEWSNEDDVYIVSLPEFPTSHTHGATREEALKNGQEVLELLIESRRDWEEPLPPPKLFEMENSETNLEQETNKHRRQKVG